MNKQIEEQVKEIREISKVIQTTGLGEHLCDAIAVSVYDADYRKVSEVVREIFAEIEKTARAAIILLKFEKDKKICNVKTECYTDLIGYIAELKKKYEVTDG